MLISSLDWLVTGMVLHAFMPTHAGLSPALVLGAYMIAQTAAVTSHVPAGAGVFEIVVLAVITHGAPDAPRAGIVAALVLFRLVYYVLPLGAAMLVVVATRSSRRVGQGVRVHQSVAALARTPEVQHAS